MLKKAPSSSLDRMRGSQPRGTGSNPVGAERKEGGFEL